MRNFGRVGLVVFGLLFVAAGYGLDWLRWDVGGYAHIISPVYWQDRATGRDIYVPEKAFLKRGSRDEPIIALTFDDGPHPTATGRILDALGIANIRATFFLVGKRMDESPDLVRLILGRGHEIANHTMNHFRLRNLDAGDIAYELEQCNARFIVETGRTMNLFRPPGMGFNDKVLSIARRLGYVTVGYTDAAKDFTYVAPDVIEERVVQHVRNGAIILLHDTPSTARALPDMIRQLQREGFRFVTVSELMARLSHPILRTSNPEASDAEKAWAMQQVAQSRSAKSLGAH